MAIKQKKREITSLAQFSFYPPSLTAFTARLVISFVPTGQQPITGNGIEKYLPGATINDFINETATVGQNTLNIQEWVTLDANNLNEWDIESTAPTTCNHATVPVANLPTCTAWTSPTAGTFTMDCKFTNNNQQVEADHFVVTVTNGLITKQTVTITLDNQLVQTNTITYTVTGVPTAAEFVRPTTCAPAAHRSNLHFRNLW